jgi:hypothetical protein
MKTLLLASSPRALVRVFAGLGFAALFAACEGGGTSASNGNGTAATVSAAVVVASTSGGSSAPVSATSVVTSPTAPSTPTTLAPAGLRAGDEEEEDGLLGPATLKWTTKFRLR